MTNWKAGDKAACIDKNANVSLDGSKMPPDGGVKCGHIYLVDDVQCDQDGVFLGLTEYPNDVWDSTSFRKIVPLSERAQIAQKATA